MISRNTLISLIVLLAGLAAGYFAYCMSGRLPVFRQQKAEWSDTLASAFSGSSLELSLLYKNSLNEFQEDEDGGFPALKDLNAEMDMDMDYHLDMQRLMEYYTDYFMHYYRWIDLGDRSSAVSYKLAMGQFWAMVDYHRNKYSESPYPEAINMDGLLGSTRIAEKTDRSVRWAKVFVVILLFLLIMGIPRFIRDRGYRKFAAALYFDALFRPFKISDLNFWHSVSRMALAFLAFYLFAGVILSSFSSWKFPVLVGALGLLPVLFLLLFINNRRRSAEICISLMAPKVLILIAVVAVMAVRGPMYFWYHIWVSGLFRAIFFAILLMLIFHKWHVHSILLRKWSHRNRKGTAAMLAMASGLQLMTVSLLLLGFGPDTGLQALNRELLLLPEHGPGGQDFLAWLALSPNFASWLFVISCILLIISLLVLLFNRKVGDSTISPGRV